MPFSWVKAPTGTSRKIRECAGDHPTKAKFESCARDIVAGDGGSVDGEIRFEPNGKFAHIHIEWDTPEQKRRIIFDLDAVETVDLYSAAEIDDMTVEAYTPYNRES
jgi:hypothetical protein